MNCSECFSGGDVEVVAEVAAPRESGDVEMRAREKYRRGVRMRRALFVLLVSAGVFMMPGLVVALIGCRLSALQLLAVDVAASVFFHPLQLLAVDWACNFDGILYWKKLS